MQRNVRIAGESVQKSCKLDIAKLGSFLLTRHYNFEGKIPYCKNMLKLKQIFAKSGPENLPVPPKSRKFAVSKGKKGQKPVNSEKTNKIRNMKVRTLDGKGLRSAGYTEFECHALIHAAGHCAAGETFQGVPTSANVVYQKSDDTFFVAARDEDTVTIIRHSNGKTLTARIIQDGEKATTTKKTETKEEMETKTAKMEQLQQAAALLELLKSNGGNDDAARERIDAIEAFVKDLAAQVEELKNQPKKVHEIRLPEKVGKVEGITHPKYDEVLAMIAEGENVYLYGPAGSGKNVLCAQVAKGLGIPFYYQNTVLTKFDLSGFKNAVGDFEKTEFFEAFTKGGLFMLDEVDNSTAEAMVALNAALANGYYSFPGIGRVDVHPDFRCIAAGNTIGTGADSAYCGRYKLDASSRDRFCFEGIDYCEEIENAITAGDDTGLLVFAHDLRRAIQEVGAEIILGYRGISRLHKWQKVFGFSKCLKKFVTKGLEEVDKDTITEVQDALRRLNTAETDWHCAFYQILD